MKMQFNKFLVLAKIRFTSFPVNNTLIDILKTIMTSEQARFVTLFHKPLNRDEIKAKSGLEDAALDNMLDDLMDNGIVFRGSPSRSSGMTVYRPMPSILRHI